MMKGYLTSLSIWSSNSTDQSERNRRISDVIQNSRDIAFHQDRDMQGEIW
jgi:hypothetical protein